MFQNGAHKNFILLLLGGISEKAVAPHSSTPAWKIPWTEEPGRLQSFGSQRVRHDSGFTFTFHFHALEKEMATHSISLAWKIPQTEEPGGLQFMGPRRIRYSLRTEHACTPHSQYHYHHPSFPFSRSAVSDSLRPHESQHARPPCPSPSPRVYSDSRPSSQ